uniref:Uncharacterized protein n=1 Tax=Timema bartmani TaxID=61472 RepID=A0A7R9F7I7_9NEOP|nr:unnamed protein product [Timema bartmani]
MEEEPEDITTTKEVLKARDVYSRALKRQSASEELCPSFIIPCPTGYNLDFGPRHISMGSTTTIIITTSNSISTHAGTMTHTTVFVSRRGDPSGGNFVTEHRERRDSVRDKPYTPMQFQNSLGKLQAGSVTSPRKLLDLEVVSNEGIDCPTTAPPKDTQRCKQMLLEIEKVS